MDDESIVKVMQTLGLNYNPAIKSTEQFEKTIGDLNKQLAYMKAIAMQSANDMNKAFSSQLGQFTGSKTIVDQYGRTFKTISQETEKTAANMGKMAKEIKQSALEQMKSQAASIQQRATTKGLSEEYSKQASTLRSQIQELQNKLQLEGKLSAEGVRQTQQLQEQLNMLKAQTGTAISDKIRENPDFLGEEFQRRTSWFLTGTIFYGMINAAKEAHATIKDVEMGMVELARVMEDSSFVFEKYRDNLFKLGIDYGQTFENVQDIALRWAQSGYNVADSLKLTETSLLALNTAELDAENATESMIGIMAQWQLQADDLGLVMDKINKTADDYTITSQDLVDGLLRSSGAARVMNLSLDETIGLLTVMREASGRTGQEVGNALNSILSYIQRPKSIDLLESLGISMFSDADKTKFRNVLDVFKDIAANWNTLSAEIQDGFVKSADDAELFNEELAGALGMQEEWNDLQQRDISQASAGVYRRNYFIGMIERLSNVQGVLNNMMDAEGYSMRENARTMETLDKKNQSLKASLQELAVAAGDAGLSGAFKTLANGGTDALNAINKMPKGMKDLVMATTSAFLAMKTFELGMKTFGIQIPNLNLGLQSLANGIDGLRIGLMYAKDGVKSFLSANAALIVLSASIGIIIALRNAWKKHREEEEKAIEVAKENIQTYKEQKQGLTELASEYETLKDKENTTADEKKRLLEIQRELVDTYGVSISGIDAEGKAYADSTSAIQERIKALEELKSIEEDKLETAVMSRDAKDVEKLENDLAKREQTAKAIEDVERRIKEARNALENSGTIKYTSFDLRGNPVENIIDASTEKGIVQLRQYIGEISGEKSALMKALGDVNTAIEEGTANRARLLKEDATEIVQQLSENGVEISDEARAFATEMAGALSQTPKDIFTIRDDLKAAIKEFASSDFEEWSQKYKKAISENDTEGIDEAANAINGLVREVSQGKPEMDSFAIAMEGLYPTTEQMASAAENAEKQTLDLADAMGRMGATAKKAMDSLKVLNQAIYDVKHGQSLSIDTVLELIEKYDLSTDAIKKTTKGYTIEVSELEKLRKKKIDTAIDGIESEKRQAEAVRDQVASRLKNYGLEIEQLKNLAEARKALARAADADARKKADAMVNVSDPLGIMNLDNPDSYANLYKKYYDEEVAKTGADLSAYEKALDDIEALEERSNLLSGMISDSSYGVTESKKAKGSKYENKALDSALKMLEHRKKMTEETQKSIQAEINELNRINKLYVKTADERMAMAERIYVAERRLKDKRLQDSVNWINEKKNLNELSAEEEIAAWERVRKNQSDNINAVKQANLNLYKLREQLMSESSSREENAIKHLTKIGIYSTQEQIDKYKELYQVKAKSIEEEQSRIENLFGLYKDLIKEQQEKIKDAYDERIKQIDEEAKRKKKVQEDIIEGIEKELELLDRQEDESDYDKNMAKLRKDLAYWQVRTSEEARKKVAEISKEIDEEEHKREVELKKQGLEDKKKIAEDGIKSIDEAAKEEKEKWGASYKLIEKAFDKHSIDMISLASTMSKGMYEEFKKNYLDKIKDAFESDNDGSVEKTVSGVDEYIKKAYEKTYNSTNAQVYRLASQILELKRQYEYSGDKSAAQRAISLYNELERLKPSVAEYLHKSNYITAKDYVSNLPKAHTGAKTLSYGAVYMKPGELIFPPDLSVKLESLIQAIYARPMQQHSQSRSLTDNRREIKIDKLLNIEKNYTEDDVDWDILAREMHRQILSMP